MPRPERPLDPTAGPIAAFAADLRALRIEAGTPKYLQMARVSGRSRTALAEAAGGYHVPTWETTEAFVRACRGDVRLWRQKWDDVQAATSRQVKSGSLAGGVTDSEVVAPAPAIEPQTRSRDDVDVLLAMWREQRTQARQSENQRALMTSLIALFAVLAITALTTISLGPGARLGVAVGLVAEGVFAAVVTAKYYERFMMHMDAAQRLRRRLDELLPGSRLETDWQSNRDQHSGNYRLLYRMKLHHLWLIIPGGIVLIGLAVATATIVDGLG